MNFENDWPGAVTENTDDFIDAVLELYNDNAAWKAAQNKTSLLLNHFDFDKHFIRFQNRIETLSKDYVNLREQNIIGSILWHHSMRSTEFMSRWIMEKNK